MVNQDLVDYIQKAHTAGRRDADITSTLIQLGWIQADVADSMQVASPSLLATIKKEWKLVAIWLGILMLFIIVCALAYLAFITPPQK